MMDRLTIENEKFIDFTGNERLLPNTHEKIDVACLGSIIIMEVEDQCCLIACQH